MPLGPSALLGLQRLAGNQAVVQLLGEPPAVQRAKTAPERLAELEKRGIVTRKEGRSGALAVKGKTKHPVNATGVHKFSGRSYYYRLDDKRVTKISGTLAHSQAKPVATA